MDEAVVAKVSEMWARSRCVSVMRSVERIEFSLTKGVDDLSAAGE